MQVFVWWLLELHIIKIVSSYIIWVTVKEASEHPLSESCPWRRLVSVFCAVAHACVGRRLPRDRARWNCGISWAYRLLGTCLDIIFHSTCLEILSPPLFLSCSGVISLEMQSLPCSRWLWVSSRDGGCRKGAGRGIYENSMIWVWCWRSRNMELCLKEKGSSALAVPLEWAAWVRYLTQPFPEQGSKPGFTKWQKKK